MAFLTDNEWGDLLRDIHNRQVIPIVGPELVTVPNAASGQPETLQESLAPGFAGALGVALPSGNSHGALNAIASAYLLGGGMPKRIYTEVATLLDRLAFPPPCVLLDLAGITDFDLFIAGTIDSLLALALEQKRPGFRRADHVRAYDYKRPIDVPDDLGPGFVYHLLGNRQTFPNFAVWEEDFLEFICGLVRHHAQLERLFLLLKTRYLLILGAPFTDWIVRFFLFVAKGGRFTERRRDDVQACLADQPENLGEPLIFFFDQVVGTTRIIRGNATAFVHELATRWQAQYSLCGGESDPLANMPDEIPRGAVFISYSRDDLAALRTLIAGLQAGQIPVWVDKQRLRAGEDYERSLECAVRVECSFFLSLISQSTETDPTRYVHKERAWAAKRHFDGFVFYIPVIVDDIPQPKEEPPEFAKIHFARIPGGAPAPEFVKYLRTLVDEWRISGQPRARDI
jgi:hypothetical protein